MKSQQTWILVAHLVAVATPLAWGQDTETPPKNEPQLTVYELRHADSISAAEQLGQFFASDAKDAVKIVPDLRANSLLVQAASRQQEMIAKILERIDVETPQEIKVFSLQYARASDLSEVLGVVADKHDVRVAFDQRTNSIFARGWPTALMSLSATLERLDVLPPDARRSLQGLRVRIVWLVEGREEQKLPAPSADLREVVAELTRLGFEDLGRVSQVLVHVDAGLAKFKAAGNAEWERNAIRLNVEGATSDVPGSLRKESAGGQVQLYLSIAVTPHGSDEQLCSLETRLTAPLGRSTVLGTTPIGSKNAVFVVQVLPPEK